MFNRLFISYKVQSIVVCVSILLLWIWICLNKYFNPQPEVKAFGGDGFVCVVWGLYFEIIIIPINSLYIELINRIKYNRVKICTNKSIALFNVWVSVCSTNICSTNIYWWNTRVLFFYLPVFHSLHDNILFELFHISSWKNNRETVDNSFCRISEFGSIIIPRVCNSHCRCATKSYFYE